MNKPKYPMSLFIMGFFMNFILRHVVLFLGAIILLFVSQPGSFFFKVGIVMLIFDAIMSLLLQLSIRKQVMNGDTDNPDIQRLQAALSKEGRWVDNVQDIVEDKVEELESKQSKMKKLKDYKVSDEDDDSDVYDDDSHVYDDEDSEEQK